MALIDRVSSLDLGYASGDLSLFPAALDSKSQLYEARNNAETTLVQSVTYNGKYLLVENTDGFPDRGIIRVGGNPGTSETSELIYYDEKQRGVFKNLIRGFAGSRQNLWPIGSSVNCPVAAEYHNACKDAILNVEADLGTEEFPAEGSLNAILKAQEIRFLAPKPLFRCYPLSGPPGVRVRFQNFSTGDTIRYLWDFGDGTTSAERNPIHTYLNEGLYTVKLTVITSTGATGLTTKNNYILVSEGERPPFFYLTPATGLSEETAAAESEDPTEFLFVDQTDGDITERYWIFDDGVTTKVSDPNEHTITHTYASPSPTAGYQPSLLVLFANQQLKRVFLKDTLIVQ